MTALHASRKYFSRYFGNRVAKEDSSVNVPPLLSAAVNGSTFHYMMAKLEWSQIFDTMLTLFRYA